MYQGDNMERTRFYSMRTIFFTQNSSPLNDKIILTRIFKPGGCECWYLFSHRVPSKCCRQQAWPDVTYPPLNTFVQVKQKDPNTIWRNSRRLYKIREISIVLTRVIFKVAVALRIHIQEHLIVIWMALKLLTDLASDTMKRDVTVAQCLCYRSVFKISSMLNENDICKLCSCSYRTRLMFDRTPLYVPLHSEKHPLWQSLHIHD